MNRYVIADTHFGDDSAIVRYEGRPFSNGREMTERLIENWNQTVEPEDTVYHLGDFAHQSLGYEETKEIIGKLNGRKVLIMGNHDQHFTHHQWMEMGFDEVYPLPAVLDGFYMFSHEPLYVSWAAPYANVFGHVHSNPAYRDYSERTFCASVERIDYRPVDFLKVKNLILGESAKKEREELKK